MHSIQRKLLKIIDEVNLGELSLRGIGHLIGEESAQKIKHHLEQLEKKGLIRLDKDNNMITRVKEGEVQDPYLVMVPIVGSADCGPATIFATENFEGYLQISKKLLSCTKDIFTIKAEGDSMNKARIGGKNIEDGDFVIINPNDKVPVSGDYVLSIIDGCVNIKRFVMDKKNNQIVLLSESTLDFPPIFIHKDDFSDYLVNGKVIQVIKKPT